MRTKTTAIVASLVIIALASSAIIGATYSWFEDEDKVTALFSPGKVSIDAEITDLKAKNYDSNSIGPNDKGKIELPSGAEVSMTTTSTTDATAVSIKFDKAAPGDSVTFKMTITNNSDIKTVWTAYATGGDVKADGKNVFDISIKCGNAEVSGYNDFETGSVDVIVTIAINTEITSMLPSSEITITVKATQPAAVNQSTGA